MKSLAKLYNIIVLSPQRMGFDSFVYLIFRRVDYLGSIRLVQNPAKYYSVTNNIKIPHKNSSFLSISSRSVCLKLLDILTRFRVSQRNQTVFLSIRKI